MAAGDGADEAEGREAVDPDRFVGGAGCGEGEGRVGRGEPGAGEGGWGQGGEEREGTAGGGRRRGGHRLFVGIGERGDWGLGVVWCGGTAVRFRRVRGGEPWG